FIAAVMTFALVNLCYGYSRTFEPFSSFDFRPQAMLDLQARLGNFPAPLPRQLLLGADALKCECEAKFPAYLLGECYTGGLWNYYPVALASKLPVSGLLLLVLMVGSLLHAALSRKRPTEPEVSVLLALVVMSALAMLSSDINVGIRYLLPLY